MDETVTLTITITGEPNIPYPAIPPIDGLVQVGRRVHSEHRYDGGSFTAVTTFEFEFRPTRPGTIAIGPIRIDLASKSFETDPFTLTVSRPAVRPTATPGPLATPSPGLSSIPSDSHFAEAVVDNETPYIGEQVTYAFSFYSRSELTAGTLLAARGLYRAPDFAGFWTPEPPSEEEFPETIKGRGYFVRQIETVLFPVLAGTISIERGRMFIYGLSREGQQSQQIDLAVRPLPPDEPASFTGAVGKFDIAAAVDLDSVTVGEAVRLRVAIRGEGNIERLSAPVWPSLAGWRSFDGDTSHQQQVADGKLVGVKLFDLVLIPDSPGDYELPGVEYSYFDPNLEQYVTISSDPIPISVAQDPSMAPATPMPSTTSPAEETDAIVDIREIKPVPGRVGRPIGTVTSSPIYWAVWGVPIAGLLITAGLGYSRRRRAAMAELRAPIEARQEALAGLSALTSGATAPDAAAAALHAYLGAALGRPTSGMRVEEVVAAVGERGADRRTALRLRDILVRLDEIRFTPAGTMDPAGAPEDVADIVHRLDQELSQ